MWKLALSVLCLIGLILATFTQVSVPFAALVEPQLLQPEIIFQSPHFFLGTYTSNLQLIAVLVSVLLLGPFWSVFTMLVYLLLGFAGVPVFFYGGGTSYLSQPTVGYLLSFLPAAWIASLALRNRQATWLQLLWSALLGLLLIHLAGGIYMAIYLQIIPIQLLLAYSLPQLPWQGVVLALASILLAWLRNLGAKHSPANSATRPQPNPI